MFAALRDHQQVFDGMLAFFPFGAAVLRRPRRARRRDDAGGAGLRQLLPTLAVSAVRGRVLTRQDDAPGAHPVAVITHRYWQRRFAGDPDIVGRTLLVGTQPLTIIGVVAPGFDGMNLATRDGAVRAADDGRAAASRRLAARRIRVCAG